MDLFGLELALIKFSNVALSFLIDLPVKHSSLLCETINLSAKSFVYKMRLFIIFAQSSLKVQYVYIGKVFYAKMCIILKY
jgi:hypothetical protein